MAYEVVDVVYIPHQRLVNKTRKCPDLGEGAVVSGVLPIGTATRSKGISRSGIHFVRYFGPADFKLDGTIAARQLLETLVAKPKTKQIRLIGSEVFGISWGIYTP